VVYDFHPNGFFTNFWGGVESVFTRLLSKLPRKSKIVEPDDNSAFNLLAYSGYGVLIDFR
jgi:hypothetical protein